MRQTNKVQPRINEKGEYRYRIVAGNGEVVLGAHQGFNSREALENNMKNLGLNPDVLPDRITKDLNPYL